MDPGKGLNICVAHGPHGEDNDSMVDCVTEYINVCLDNTIPTSKGCCFAKNKPWITSDLKEMTRKEPSGGVLGSEACTKGCQMKAEGE